jgi:hypothetical protein
VNLKVLKSKMRVLWRILACLEGLRKIMEFKLPESVLLISVRDYSKSKIVVGNSDQMLSNVTSCKGSLYNSG